jgi:hypothetical protein
LFPQAGGLEIGGSNLSTGLQKGNISLNDDGSITATGSVTTNNIDITHTDASAALVIRETGATASSILIEQDGSQTLRFDSSGAASFAGGDITMDANGNMTVSGTGQYTGAQRGDITTTAGFGGFTFNFNASNNYQLNLVGTSTLNNPTNQVAGQHGVILVTQDGTGSRTLAFGSNWKFPGGVAPTLSTAANAQDLLAYYVSASGTIFAQLILDLK